MSGDMSSETPAKHRLISRRGFLIAFGVTATAAVIGVKVALPYGRLRIAEFIDESNGASPTGDLPFAPDAWFEITTDNRVRFLVPKIEMGQGVHTSLGQIAADELEVAWADLDVVQPSTLRSVEDSSGTGNSNSVSSMYLPIREAAATLRELLRAEAARQWGVPVAAVVAANTAVHQQDNPDQRFTYGELVQYAADWQLPEAPPTLKPADQFNFIGKPVQRVDFTSKLTGTAVYGYDVRLPNMLYGAVARPSTIEGKLRSAQVGNAANVPGVVQAVIEDDFVGVVAESRLAAYAGIGGLEVTWDDGKLWQQAEIEALVTVGEGQRVVIQKEGDDTAALLRADDPDVLRLTFRSPLAAHAHLEAQAALVDVRPDKVEAWVSTQSPFVVRDELAKVLKREPETVSVTPTYLGGGFGRKLNVESATEAARLSAAVGRPVHVGWNRTEDLRYGFFRPPTHHVVQGKLDGNGRLQAMQHEVASGDVLFSFFPGFVSNIIGADFGAYRGAPIQYGIANRQTISYRAKLPVRTGSWRGLGLLANTYAIETFMDLAAAKADADPLMFRLNHLPNSERGERFRTVLERVAEASGWGRALPAGHALGLALALDANTVVAQVAQVSLTDGGQIRVHEVTAVIDPGQIINPDGVKAQTEGAIMMGLSSALFEEITIKDGQIEAANFDGYPLLTMKEAPNIRVELVESGDMPNGVGEPPIGPIAAAVGNAIFRLTGQHPERLPMRMS